MQKGEDLDFGTRPVYDAEDLRLQKRAQRQSSWLNVLRIISRILDLVTSYLPPHPPIPHSPPYPYAYPNPYHQRRNNRNDAPQPHKVLSNPARPNRFPTPMVRQHLHLAQLPDPCLRDDNFPSRLRGPLHVLLRWPRRGRDNGQSPCRTGESVDGGAGCCRRRGSSGNVQDEGESGVVEWADVWGAAAEGTVVSGD